MPSPSTMTTVTPSSGGVPTEELYPQIPGNIPSDGLEDAVTTEDISLLKEAKELKKQGT
jgi:hypothetical protein